ncbi:MAG: hypothetical protein KIT00_05790 [Rhodospirillales bacterium]|nr:hypothetical protein [Rhodospirillales bacterium]
MPGENEAKTLDNFDESQTMGAQKRERSSIGFPYMDLSDVLQAASVIHANVGTGTCSADQLAAWLGTSPTSSAFRVRLSASRMFGLIEADRSESIRLTHLGQRAMDPQQERAAWADAFLSVPLYRAVYEKFKGNVLPPTAALEREIVAMGVAEKQKSRARQVMERAAEQAGFLESGGDRLVKPGIVEKTDTGKSNERGRGGGSGNSGGGQPPDVDPIIAGLLARLPKPGSKWPKAQRKIWLGLFEGSFDLIYEDDDGEKPPSLRNEDS